jgi:GAF domain-containing protein
MEIVTSEIRIYEDLIKTISALLLPSDKVISNLAIFIAAIKIAFKKISWIGFYINENGILYLGPFQGNPACSEITVGTGVCGISAERQKTIYVEDVNKFSEHIICDPNSKSEIVVPIMITGNLWGVLDVDSYNYSAFTDTDRTFLEKLRDILVKKIDLNSYILK